MTRWLEPDPINLPASFSGLKLHPLVAQTLLRRGINSPAEAEAFLHPEALSSTKFPNIEIAVERILLAIRSHEIICVWGDFDVDGQTSTALLVQTLRSLNARVVYYIPIRGKESHGIHLESLRPILDNGTKLIVTCDTGITAHEAVDYSNSRGVDVIITDHHDRGEVLPNAKVIINPKLLPRDHPLRNLAGVGVAYKLAEALLAAEDSNSASQLSPVELLDLVALGLIADVALLKGETRSLAQRGIQKLRETSRIGLRAIAELSGTHLETLTEETIGFTFAPRLNALGRLGDANPAVELLLTQDAARARVLAAQIEGLNAQRRLLTSQVYEAAEAQLKENPALLTEPAILLSHPNWPGGVVGIVANRLVARYHKPTILFNESEEGVLRGSARSIEGLHITEAIASQKDLIHSFGGHPMAAGLSLQKEQLASFRRGLGKAIEKQLGEVSREEATLQIDSWLGLEEINFELADALEMLAPFGAGNPELTLATHNVTLKSATGVGKTKEHLRLTVEDQSGNSQSLFWWGGAEEELPEKGSTFDVAYSLRANSYRGKKQLSMQFQEFRVTEEKPVELHDLGFDIRDLRLDSSMFDRQNGETLVWAEGSDTAKGKSRYDLKPAQEFAIYTTPPSPLELRHSLEKVKPKTIYVFAVSPMQETPEDFLNRLAGLCKYALLHRNGKTTIQALTTAMASRENAIQIGLEWLAAGGQVMVIIENDRVSLSSDRQEKNPYLQAELFIALKGILREISAYRKYFASADLKTLF